MSKPGIIKPEIRYLLYFAVFWVVLLAAGTVNVWSTTIQELRLGDMTFYNVPGTINPAMDPDMVLLGMSVLGQLNFSQQSGVLTLSQDNR
ncbi:MULTISPECIES: retropepsin-like aspartic protease family protein [Marinobacter]|uniref:retropepsin-like aspartic protease family protein n=1 Tax=Marinobacter TaxID=2742 RepID=UPI003B43472B|nr:retropepsin-like aspartic protease [Marinobacter alkaliphilus]